MAHYTNTNHKGQEQAQKEHPEGHHATPVSMIVQFFNWINTEAAAPKTFLDPGAGDLGGFGFAAKHVWPDIHSVGVEIRTDARPAGGLYDEFKYGDFLDSGLAEANGERFDFVATNPTFAIAEETLRQALIMTKPGGIVAFLLDLGWQTSIDRAEGVHRQTPPQYVMPISPRPSFYWYLPENANGNTNYKHYNWMVWHKPLLGRGWTGMPMWKPFVWEKLLSVEGEFRQNYSHLWAIPMDSHYQKELI